MRENEKREGIENSAKTKTRIGRNKKTGLDLKRNVDLGRRMRKSTREKDHAPRGVPKRGETSSTNGTRTITNDI